VEREQEDKILGCHREKRAAGADIGDATIFSMTKTRRKLSLGGCS
jgi:hypothetical protein